MLTIHKFKMSFSNYIIFIVALLLSSTFAFSDDFAEDELGIENVSRVSDRTMPYTTFRDLVTFNHFDIEYAKDRNIGLEVEGGGLRPEEVVEILLEEFGGEYQGLKLEGTEEAHVIENTAIGRLKVEPVNLQRLVNRLEETQGIKLSRLIVEKIDNAVGTWEIVTEPLKYHQVQIFAKAIDVLGLAGAKGTGINRLVSFQTNVEIKTNEVQLFLSLMRNYYSNMGIIRNNTSPNWLRRFYIRAPKKRFLARLQDLSWNPTMEEFFEEYQKSSPLKLARLNLYNALLVSNKAEAIQGSMAKLRVARPVSEHREANMTFSNARDQTRGSRALMQEVNFALAFTSASEKGDVISLNRERIRFSNLSRLGSSNFKNSIFKVPQLRDSVGPSYKSHLKTAPIENSRLFFKNIGLLSNWGFDMSAEGIEEEIIKKFSVSVVDGQQATDNTSQPFALAYNDGAGGTGDGRALSFESVHGSLQNTKGNGLTPYTLKSWAIKIGFHSGGVDGKMALNEGVRTLFIGELLHNYGIPSERVVALIDSNETSQRGDEERAAAIMVRSLPGGGIRNAHLSIWNKQQIRNGLDFLKATVSAANSRPVNDSILVALDATKSAQMAARMQDMFIVHGALTKANILAFPGMVDTDTVRFLSIPDPNFTSVATRSRFGNQAGRIRELMLERKKFYEKVNPNLKKIGAKSIFNKEFQKELSILTLQRLGISRELVISIYKKEQKLVDEYTNLVWKHHFKYLRSDIRKIQSGTAEIFANESTVDQVWSSYHNVDRAKVRGKENKWLKLITKDSSQASISLKEVKSLVAMGNDILLIAQDFKPESSVNFSKRAREISNQSAPTIQNIELGVEKVIKAKKSGASLGDALSEGLEYIEKFKGSMTNVEQCSEIFL